ncbi:MAG: hypothetical protein DDT32_01801 [Syntrophomonadaceae bacterium]|nr:hypothetical protein [Bacillota bacterium]MBT9148032.1 hypothetical protein [Bacillota bacterium]
MMEHCPQNQGSQTSQTGSLLSCMSVSMDAYPPAFQGNALNLLFLEDAQPIRCAREYLRGLDSPNLCEDCREYLISGEHAIWPFPVHCMAKRPDPWSLSERLYDCFTTAQYLLPTQREVGRILCEKAAKLQPDIVALMIVDGLSYYDLPDKADAEPCLVNGVSTTDFGYREVIGKPTVSERLFSLGYSHQMGFTYFDIEANPLAGKLYGVFGSSQVKRVATFKECLEHIGAEGISHGFVQITAPGLDGLCHHHQDEPPVKHYIDEILNRFDALVNCLHDGYRNVLACLTADHGILWRQHLEGQWYVVTDLQPGDARYIRYIPGSRMRNYVLVKSCLGSAYSMLRVPYITRKLRNNEWGVHGGISAWESIVPLIIRTT